MEKGVQRWSGLKLRNLGGTESRRRYGRVKGGPGDRRLELAPRWVRNVALRGPSRPGLAPGAEQRRECSVRSYPHRALCPASPVPAALGNFRSNFPPEFQHTLSLRKPEGSPEDDLPQLLRDPEQLWVDISVRPGRHKGLSARFPGPKRMRCCSRGALRVQGVLLGRRDEMASTGN